MALKRILFFCGSLEPGRDGVGDYTRLLGAELQGQNIGIHIVATHDKAVSTVCQEQQLEDNCALEVTRIPFTTPMTERFSVLQETIDRFAPDWLSLQYVPYSFDANGIPFAFILRLNSLRLKGSKHVMFHELWRGKKSLRQLKSLFIAPAQLIAVRLLYKRFAPQVIHTHLPFHQSRLKEQGIAASPLPLFPNIRPVATTVVKGDKVSKAIFRVAFFSKMGLPDPVKAFLTELDDYVRQTLGASLIVTLLGGGKEKVQATAEQLKALLPAATIEPIGFLSSTEISTAFYTVDLAITPLRRRTLGKSGTVAAFLRHGLPVAAPVAAEDPSGFFNPKLNAAILTEFSPDGLAAVTHAAQNLDTSKISVEHISKIFCNDLALLPKEASVSL